MSSDFDLEERSRNKVEERAHRIKMEWDTPAFDGKILLLVENKNDRRCYFKLFNPDHVEIQTTEGCNNMRHLFAAIQMTGVPNFAIQDSDFSRVCGKEPPEDNYFITDYHDHEMMCLAEEDVMKALFVNKATAYDKVMVDEVFDDLTLLSQYKWFNYYHHSNVNFSGYKVRGRSKSDLCSFSSINAEVMPQSPNCHVSIKEADVTTFVNGQPQIDRFELTNGHDFVDLLAQRIGEKTKEANLRTEDLRIIMYANFVSAMFRRTNLYRDICNWAGGETVNLFAA